MVDAEVAVRKMHLRVMLSQARRDDTAQHPLCHEGVYAARSQNENFRNGEFARNAKSDMKCIK
jgi:hypothetical protein